MQVITPEELRLRKQEIQEKILDGEIFIHPTDTIYGLGCNALDKKAVEKIREIKNRPNTPFSIIAPSKDWIRENCIISKEAEKWLEKLPGPFTFILKTKGTPVAEEVAPTKDSLGVRMPRHWITSFIKWLGIPIVTTSVNVVDEPFLTKIEDLENYSQEPIKKKLNFAIYEGEKPGKPSKIINLESEEPKIKER